MFEFNATFVAQIINFLVLAAILAKFAYKPLLKALEERRERIANDLKNAQQERTAAEQLRREYQEQMAQARSQAQAIIDKATKAAEQMSTDILEAARAENAKMLKMAQDEIALQTDKAISELRTEVVSMTLAVTAKIIGQNLNKETNAKMVADFIDKLDQDKTGGLPC